MPTTETLVCPPLGHKAFEKALRVIRLEDADTPTQISKFVRPSTCVVDELGLTFLEGELQAKDLTCVKSLFNYQGFIARTFNANRELFRHSQCRIYQFQSLTRSNDIFCFGLFITDSSHNLIDFCTETPHAEKRRRVLLRLIRLVCTPASVAFKLSH